MMSALSRLEIGIVAGGLILAACAGGADQALATAPADELADRTQRQLAIFEELHGLIKEGYLYPDFGGVDWDAEGNLLRHRIESGLSDDAFEERLGSLVDLLPTGTASYVTREQRVAAEFDAMATYEGIGAFVSVRSSPVPRILLLSVIEDSPAAAAGLRAHDAVLAVDGQPVTAEEGISVVERVRGPEGTEVRLKVVSPAEEPREVSVLRGRVTAQDVIRGGVLFPGMFYVLAPVAADSTLVEVVAGMLQSQAEQEDSLQGLVLDLRIAGSGSDWPLTEMLALLGDGEMGTFVSREGKIPMVVQGQDIGQSQSIPLAILIGPDTSGAPELFAAAMQAKGRATLVGMPTSGNILTFQQKTLSDGSQLSFADSSFVTLSGRDLGLTGLIPNLPVDADWDQIEPADDPVLFEAVNWLLAGG